MNMRWPLILTVLLAASCSRTKGRNSLADRVDFACGLLTSELATAAEKYREYAGWIAEGRLSPGQQGRAETNLQYGTTERERRVAGHGVHQQLRFCATTRDIDDHRSGAFLTRAADAVEKFKWGMDPAQTATSVKALADLAAEIKALPIRD